MLRRTFIWSTPGSLLAVGAALAGCTYHPFFQREPR